MNDDIFQKLENEILDLKSSVFKFWDSIGHANVRTTLNFFSLAPRTSIVIKKWIYDWYGGDDYFETLKSEIKSKIFRCQIGTYNFLFVVTDLSSPDYYSDYEVNVNTEVDSKGSCYIETDDGTVYEKIIEAIKDENIGWEVDDEVKDSIYDTLNEKYEFFRTFHINVVEIDFVNF
jgi:hypothetical protein